MTVTAIFAKKGSCKPIKLPKRAARRMIMRVT